MFEQAEEVKSYDNADKRKSYIWMALDWELEDIFSAITATTSGIHLQRVVEDSRKMNDTLKI